MKAAQLFDARLANRIEDFDGVVSECGDKQTLALGIEGEVVDSTSYAWQLSPLAGFLTQMSGGCQVTCSLAC